MNAHTQITSPAALTLELPRQNCIDIKQFRALIQTSSKRVSSSARSYTLWPTRLERFSQQPLSIQDDPFQLHWMRSGCLLPFDSPRTASRIVGLIFKELCALGCPLGHSRRASPFYTSVSRWSTQFFRSLAFSTQLWVQQPKKKGEKSFRLSPKPTVPARPRPPCQSPQTRTVPAGGVAAGTCYCRTQAR